MAIYTQTLTGADSDFEPTNDSLNYTMTGPGSELANVSLTNDDSDDAIFEWDTVGLAEKIETTITFTTTDMYGASTIKIVDMKTWFPPILNQINDIDQPVGLLYTSIVSAGSREAGLTVALTYIFPSDDAPDDFSFVDNNNNTATITWTPSTIILPTLFTVTATDDGPLNLTAVSNVQITTSNLPVFVVNGDFEFDVAERSSTVGNDNITGWTVDAGTMNVKRDTIIPIPIINAGAEEATMLGWNEGTGLYYASATASTDSHSGNRYFHGGVVGLYGVCEFDSDPIDISEHETHINIGAWITLDYWQLSFESNNDPGRGMIRFYSDIEGTALIGTSNNEFYNGPSEVWENRVDTYIIPVGTKSVRIVGQCDIVGLNYASAYFDDFSLTLLVPTNVFNGDAEMATADFQAPPFGWTVSPDSTAIRSCNTRSHTGTYSFEGGDFVTLGITDAVMSSAEIVLEHIGYTSNNIDAGTETITLDYWMSSQGLGDLGKSGFRFLNEAGDIISESYDTLSGPAGWTHRILEHNIPAWTRHIQVISYMEVHVSNYCSVFLDDFVINYDGDITLGGYIMDAGTNAVSNGTSDSILILATPAEIDAGNISIKVQADQSSRSATDTGQFGVRFFDEVDVQVGADILNTMQTVFNDHWVERSHIMVVPVGARKMSTIWAAAGDGTGNNDVIFDNFEITIV